MMAYYPDAKNKRYFGWRGWYIFKIRKTEIQALLCPWGWGRPRVDTNWQYGTSKGRKVKYRYIEWTPFYRVRIQQEVPE